MKKNLISACMLFLLLSAYDAQCSTLPEPVGKVILTISGLISNKNSNDAARFDLNALESLGVTRINTHTPWFKGVSRFEGVSLAKLMQTVGAHGRRVKVTALNDYMTIIPVSDFSRHHPILAYRRDGKIMTVRDKGPLFIIYPYDKETELENHIFYSRSAWQVYTIEVE